MVWTRLVFEAWLNLPCKINLISFVKFRPFKFGFKFYRVFGFGFAGKLKFDESRINKQIYKCF
ncbi:hypothetical protein [uncultured Campylobacter sp.]|uniref:hypothetical protein n=1 Tax=uncultured Campylobacter sp. TaxID=218934 RepID=UPI00262A491F|nr:hypothetical protein [uncultured Campylobacter sp.]